MTRLDSGDLPGEILALIIAIIILIVGGWLIFAILNALPKV